MTDDSTTPETPAPAEPETADEPQPEPEAERPPRVPNRVAGDPHGTSIYGEQVHFTDDMVQVFVSVGPALVVFTERMDFDMPLRTAWYATNSDEPVVPTPGQRRDAIATLRAVANLIETSEGSRDDVHAP